MIDGYYIRREWTETLQGAELLVYAYISQTCDSCGGVCECSKANIAYYTGASIRNITYAINSLCERELLQVEKQAGRFTRYIANPCKNCTPAKIAPVQKHVGVECKNCTPHIPILKNSNINNSRIIVDRSARARVREQADLDFVAEEYMPVFSRWLDYKKERREKYKSVKSLEACYNRLLKLSGGDPTAAADIVEQSIANNWAGLFELKERSINHGTSNRQQEYSKAVNAAIIAGLAAQ